MYPPLFSKKRRSYETPAAQILDLRVEEKLLQSSIIVPTLVETNTIDSAVLDDWSVTL